MFFVSKKKFDAAVEEEVNRRIAEYDRQVSLNRELNDLHRVLCEMDNRLCKMENPLQSGCCERTSYN